MSLSQELVDNLNNTSLDDIMAGLELDEDIEDDIGYLELSNFEGE